jgi:hypothetical protein
MRAMSDFFARPRLEALTIELEMHTQKRRSQILAIEKGIVSLLSDAIPRCVDFPVRPKTLIFGAKC